MRSGTGKRCETDSDLQVGILEPKYQVSQVQGQVIKADSAAKSLRPIPPKPAATEEAKAA